MNFNGFSFDDGTRSLLEELDRASRVPHAVIIESPDAEKAMQAAVFLSMYALCDREEKPCGKCKNCLNAKNRAHPDVTYLTLQAKKTVYTVEQMRDLIKDAYILPNEANAKAYIFENCDERLSVQAQNTFLKLSEEPPPNVFFILLCRSAQSLLDTILSRFTVIRLKGDKALDKELLTAARDIAGSITENREYPLLKALNALTDKEKACDILSAVKLILRDALVILSGGEARTDEEAALKLAGRLTKSKLIEMIELCDSSSVNIKQNANINLLTTRMCGEFRRITWQR